MNTRELECVLRSAVAASAKQHADSKLPLHFLGVFPADEAERIILAGGARSSSPPSYPCCLVANTDPSTRSGSHWVVFLFRDAQTLEFFDSYGYHPAFHMLRIDRNQIKNLYWSRQFLQSPGSVVCGHYCVYYLLMRARGHSMYTISKFLTSMSQPRRDCHVSQFAVQAFRVTRCTLSRTVVRTTMQHCKPRTM